MRDHTTWPRPRTRGRSDSILSHVNKLLKNVNKCKGPPFNYVTQLF